MSPEWHFRTPVDLFCGSVVLWVSRGTLELDFVFCFYAQLVRGPFSVKEMQFNVDVPLKWRVKLDTSSRADR